MAKHLAVLRADIYHDGANFLGVSDVAMPTFALKTTEVAGFGLPGTFNLPNQGQMDAAEITLNFPVLDKDALSIFKIGQSVAIDLRNVHAVVNSSTLEIGQANVRWAVTIAVVNFNPGTIKPGELNAASVVGQIMRAQMWVDGSSMFTFNFFGDELEQDGDDMAGTIRSALD